MFLFSPIISIININIDLKKVFFLVANAAIKESSVGFFFFFFLQENEATASFFFLLLLLQTNKVLPRD